MDVVYTHFMPTQVHYTPLCNGIERKTGYIICLYSVICKANSHIGFSTCVTDIKSVCLNQFEIIRSSQPHHYLPECYYFGHTAQ